MSDEQAANNFAMTHIPTSRERMRRALGFRYHLGNEPEGIETLSGWSRTAVRFRFGWLDRLRMLTTGKLLIVVVSHYDAPSPAIIRERVDWQIAAPGEQFDA